MWRGSLYLADYLLSQPDILPGCGPLCVLEIGAGTGLLSVLASIHPSVRRVVATDLDNVVPLLERNIKRNLGQDRSDITIKELDLRHPGKVSDVDLVLGADVIYDDELTSAIIGFFRQLAMGPSSTHVILSFEKRWNFTLDALAVTAPAFDYFIKGLAALKDELPDGALDLDWSLMGEEEETLPQFFCYERSKDLNLLRIQIRSKVSAEYGAVCN